MFIMKFVESESDAYLLRSSHSCTSQKYDFFGTGISAARHASDNFSGNMGPTFQESRLQDLHEISWRMNPRFLLDEKK